ncbi:transcriptional regulator [Streptomyces sp. NPDC005925]|uniref:transcriptional regulator n=1 Tax=Streptomyces sp. NPDC005925 TaxID=3157172 RepID=UPI00340087F4
MTRDARQLLESATRQLAPDAEANPFVSLVARGAAGGTALAALAQEQHGVIAADRRSFLHLAQRSAADEPDAAAFFAGLAEGEALAGERLETFARACGVDGTRAREHEPLPGCQAYPAYVAWLALNGSPADVILALTANFAAWGGYCATLAGALREHYGFTDEQCAFFDFFAGPAPDLDRQATAAVQQGLDTGDLDERLAHRYGRLLQHCEAMFWATLAGTAQRRLLARGGSG